jgi:hypothetical protein
MAPEKIHGWRRSSDFSRPFAKVIEALIINFQNLSSEIVVAKA